MIFVFNLLWWANFCSWTSSGELKRFKCRSSRVSISSMTSFLRSDFLNWLLMLKCSHDLEKIGFQALIAHLKTSDQLTVQTQHLQLLHPDTTVEARPPSRHVQHRDVTMWKYRVRQALSSCYVTLHPPKWTNFFRYDKQQQQRRCNLHNTN
jgi:hypothetical protein